MRLNTGAVMHNKFHFRLEDGNTGACKQEAWAYNIVLNKYYQKLNSTAGFAFESIVLGTGTGVPAPTDTDLFNGIALKQGSSGDLTILSDTSFSRTLTVTFTEQEAIGLLTEVGICYSTYQEYSLFSHAMLTDAEGQTITIEKTNTDRLTITATIYCSITYPQGIIPIKPTPLTEICLALPAQDSLNSGSTITYARSPQAWKRLLGAPPDNRLTFCEGSQTKLGWAHNGSYSDLNPGARISLNRILSTDGNREYTYQIKGIATDYGVIPLPNADLFPPLSLELEQVADGETTGFNFGIAELMQEVKVFIDNVEQDASTYTWNGKDFSLRQAWVSQNGDYLIEHPPIVPAGSYTYAASPIIYWYGSARAYEGTPEFVYDFGTPKTINQFRTTGYYTSNPQILYYSSDKATWTEAARLSPQSQSTASATIDPPISARYWKTALPGVAAQPSEFIAANQYLGAFDYVTNQLEFNNPPPAGAVIKIQTKSAYPIKNSNWIVDQVIFDWYLNKEE